MAVDERARHELHGRLTEMLGREEATTLLTMVIAVAGLAFGATSLI
jgi:hypothetical protein